MARTGTKIGVWNRALSRIGETQFVESDSDNTPAASVCEAHWEDVLGEVFETRHWSWAVRQLKLSNIDEQTTTATGDASTTVFQIPVAFRTVDQLVVELDDVVQASGYTIDQTVNTITFDTAPGAGVSVEIVITTSREGWDHAYLLPSDMITPISLLFDSVRYERVNVTNRGEYDIQVNDAADGQILLCNYDEDEFVGLIYVSNVKVQAWPRHFVDAVTWRLAAELAAGIRKDPKIANWCMQNYVASLDAAAAWSFNLGHTLEPETPALHIRAGYDGYDYDTITRF